MKGYSNELYILAFDHRGTLTKGLLGVEGRQPTVDEASRVSSMKDIIFDGFIEAKNSGISGGDPAILVDETFGLQVQQKAKEMGIKYAAPVEKSGQKVFDFEYGDAFGEKIIEVDGGVSIENSAVLAKNGAVILVAGSAIFKSDDPIETIIQMKKS